MFLNRRAQLFLGFAAVALASARGEAVAATLEVTATVPDACTVEGGTLAFGTYNAGPTAPGVQADGQFNVQCTAPAEVEIGLDGGLSYGQASNSRAMKGPGDNYLGYVLFSGTTAWDKELRIPFQVAVGANPITVTGVIHENQTVPGGEYSDTVQITLTFN